MLADPAAAPAATGKSSSRRRLSHTAAADIEKVARASRGGARAGGVYFYQPRPPRAMHCTVQSALYTPPTPPQPTVPSPLCQLSSSSAAWKLTSAGPVMYSKLHLQPTDKSALCCASRKAVRMKIHRDVLPCQAAAEGQFLISLGRSKLRGSGSEFGAGGNLFFFFSNIFLSFICSVEKRLDSGLLCSSGRPPGRTAVLRSIDKFLLFADGTAAFSWRVRLHT